MITDSLLNPVLRQQARLLHLLKETLPPTMQIENMTIYIQSNRVYIGVQNAMVAQQWVYIKNKVLEKLKEQDKKIKEIRIQIEPNENKHSQKRKTLPCQRCGTVLLREGENHCAFCRSLELDAQRQRIFQFLREAPWIRYQDLEENDKKLIDYEAFMRERTFQINRIYDKIGMEYWSWYRNKDLISLNQFKTSIEEYVITKLNIHPQDLTGDHIKSNVSARWYKLYEQRNQKEGEKRW